jgi:Spy/CpxP family protein refolding chaperone
MGPPSLEDRLKQLKEKLDLTKDQVEKVKKILQNSDKKREELFENGNEDREAMREQMMKIREESDKKIELLLSEKQKAKYEELKKDRRMRMGPRPGDQQQNPPPPPPEGKD